METLAQRMITHELGQRDNGLDMASKGELGVGETFVGRQDELFKARSCRSSEPIIGQTTERRTAQHAEGGREEVNGELLIAGARGFASVTNEPLQPDRVDVVGLDRQHIARLPSYDGLAAQNFAQRRNQRLQRVRRVSWLLVSPQLVDEAISRHRERNGKGQQGEERL